MLRVPSSELDAALAHPFLHEDLAPGFVVDIDDASWQPSAQTAAALRALPSVTVAVAPTPPAPGASAHRSVVESFDLIVAPNALSDDPALVTGDTDELLADVLAKIEASPDASIVLAQLLRMSATLAVRDALIAESLAYATLQTGPTFQRWLADRRELSGRQGLAGSPQQSPSNALEPALLVESSADEWTLTFNRPGRHNAFSTDMRDLLVEALRTALAAEAPSIRLRGHGPSFCSGGDLSEFGSTPDSATGHMVRSVRSAPWWVHMARRHTVFELHGSCFGAGIELAAFSERVIADPDTAICLPEVRFGLVPGAGGTVSIPRRIGRHRTLWLALTGTPLDAPTSLAWGLVDELSAK